MLKRVPILTGGSERRGPAPLPPPALPEVRAPPPAASEALEAPTRSIRIALLRAALSVPLFSARSRSGALRLSTHSSEGREAPLPMFESWLRLLCCEVWEAGSVSLSLLIPKGKRIVPASWKVEFFHVKSLRSAWRVGNTPQTLAAAI